MLMKLILFVVSLLCFFQAIQARCYMDDSGNYVCIDENWWEKQNDGVRAGLGLGIIFVIILPCILCCYCCCCRRTQHTTVVMGGQPGGGPSTTVINNTNMMQQQTGIPYERQVNYPM
ncbi:uncharacterized protein LOC130614663 [Hydractinia symbiolongicarpus]|uniref:uncharacterized protein LOC130614663 n=1 Tax=Hydractinia symbiolongicarpus TaxID=13093 RepID=UPI002550336E|nr:uncharacterized protein LOC130614663 [Hydractinia symbiolongicarpus]